MIDFDQLRGNRLALSRLLTEVEKGRRLAESTGRLFH
jgi:hypothetical protein